MTVYMKSVEKQEQEQANARRKAQLTYKIRKGLSGNHETVQAISYSEYMTNHLNDQRPFDRPHGRSERTRWYSSHTLEWTYSAKEADTWKKNGQEVFEYNDKNVLVEITNSHYTTRKQYKGIEVKYTYNK